MSYQISFISRKLHAHAASRARQSRDELPEADSVVGKGGGLARWHCLLGARPLCAGLLIGRPLLLLRRRLRPAPEGESVHGLEAFGALGHGGDSVSAPRGRPRDQEQPEQLESLTQQRLVLPVALGQLDQGGHHIGLLPHAYEQRPTPPNIGQDAQRVRHGLLVGQRAVARAEQREHHRHSALLHHERGHARRDEREHLERRQGGEDVAEVARREQRVQRAVRSRAEAKGRVLEHAAVRCLEPLADGPELRSAPVRARARTPATGACLKAHECTDASDAAAHSHNRESPAANDAGGATTARAEEAEPDRRLKQRGAPVQLGQGSQVQHAADRARTPSGGCRAPSAL
mmetsp:Transcript_10135/g.33446  ORF Transcript_10135/g.33446 Transcript_10135/m.33446 type:complete len:346 (-) Transcript_10135:84-1121(-)